MKHEVIVLAVPTRLIFITTAALRVAG